ncbi:hypothetical protein GCM10010271_57320 [Streptomyces kurssanovii]|nr:hypothetical protein GCM10010271_57320 [Streptomyces kurssanovii]
MTGRPPPGGVTDGPRDRGSVAVPGRAAYGRAFVPAVLMAYALLHVYGNLPWHCGSCRSRGTRMPRPLAEAWFGTA